MNCPRDAKTNVRIIPRLDIKGPNVVKGIHMEGLRVVGNPLELAQKYYQSGADEILYLDIVASLYQRSFDFELLKRVTQDVFIPITVGGGIRSVDDVRDALRVGADKVAINTAAIRRPELISEASSMFGAQCVVLYVEAKRRGDGTWEAYTDGGREKTGVDVEEWIPKAVELGAGEVLLSSIDADGTKTQYDTELIGAIAPHINVPLVVHGGAATVESGIEVLAGMNIDALAASSIFHYGICTVKEAKEVLKSHGVNVRI